MNLYLFSISSFSTVDEKVNIKKYNDNKISVFFPYALGIIWAYAKQNKKINDNYKLINFEFKRKKPSLAIDSMKKNPPDVVAFSNYIWNGNYHLQLMRQIKKYWPKTLIIVGGPSVSQHKEWYQDKPYIDIASLQEGEYIFRDVLLENLNVEKNFGKISGIFYNNGNDMVYTGKSNRIENIDEIPSPYLTGVFDDMVKKFSDIYDFHAPIETNRGCPFKCTYCDWGGLTHQKMKKFNIKRSYDELNWIVKNKISGVIFTDSNLGIFKDRDISIIEKFIDLHKKTGYPKFLHTAGYSKTPLRTNGVYEIQKMLHDHNTRNSSFAAPHVAIQSFDKNVLKHVKRNNLDIANYQLLHDKNNNVDFNVELIFPLPGSNYETMKSDLLILMKNKNSKPRLFPLIGLPKSQFSTKEYMKEHGIVFTRVPYNHTVDDDFEEYDKEYCNLVYETKYCSNEEIKRCWLYFWIVMRFWYTPFFKKIAKQFEFLYDISYSTFFSDFQIWLETLNEGFIKTKFYDPIYKNILSSNFSCIPDHISNNHYTKILIDGYEIIYDEIRIFLEQYYSEIISYEQIKILINLQKNEFSDLSKTGKIMSNGWSG